MNKQKRLLELLLILVFISGLCTMIWWSNPYAPSKQFAFTKTDTATAHVNTHPSPQDSIWWSGKALFKSNCASCHNATVAQTGPALAGVSKRWDAAGAYKGKTGKEWLHVWIHNWNETVSLGYPYAITIKQQYNQSPMNTFPTLRDDQIDAILVYVEDSKRHETMAVVTY